jgi:tyrosyl-tRNA synthetase
MASSTLFRSSLLPGPYVCARCAFRASKGGSKTSKRWLGIKYLAKVADAESNWAAKAKLIMAGDQKSMLTILEERGLVHQIAGYDVFYN